MKMLSEHLKQFFLLTCFFAFTVTTVQAQDLNAALNGTYAVHTNWGCTHFDPNVSTDPDGNVQLTTAGEISYFGDGTAEEMGRFGFTDHHNNVGDLGRYECTWAYEVNDDPDLDCNIDNSTTPIVGAIGCDFKYEGSCDVVSFVSPGGGPQVIDQVWYGKIGIGETKDKKGVAKTSGNVLLIERHDGNPERDNDVTDSPFNICGKNGVQLKISDTPKDLIPE